MSSRAIGKVLASTIAVLGAGGLTLLCIVALVQGTIRALSLESVPLRVVAVIADIVLGTVLLIGCVYLATRLAVVIVGVGRSEFPSFPGNQSAPEVRSEDSSAKS
jgi:hypothetical protein